jgi:hypothetical protein
MLIEQAVEPLKQLATATAAVAGVSLLDTAAPETPNLPIQIADVKQLVVSLSGMANFAEVYADRPEMRNAALRQRILLLEQRTLAAEQELAGQKAVNQAQELWLRELSDQASAQSAATAEQKAHLLELATRLDLVKASVQNLAVDLATNQAHDAAQEARLTAAESQLAAEEQAIKALQVAQTSTAAALAANTAADQLNAAQDAVTQATAAQALALGQAEHATNVAQQSQLDANAAQDALDRARQTADEQAIAAAQATANQALQKANDDATAASQALAAAQAAQATATQASQAAATAQATATSAATAAAAAQTSATNAKTAADAAQVKADADAIAAANAQATATAAQQAAATNATALAALQTALAGKLDAALVRRGSVTSPPVTIVVATPATVQVTFATPFADANYEVFLSKPAGGLLGVELGWQNKTAAGFTMTERNTGLVSLAVPASTVDFFAIRN